jgi:hypothetical protein
MTIEAATPGTVVDGPIQWRRIVRWSALGLAAALAVTVLVVHHARSATHDGLTIKYSSAQSMAAKAGCASSFAASTAHSGVTSIGSCAIDGSKVTFVVLPNVDAAYAWLDGANAIASPRQYGGVGDGWVVIGPDEGVQSAVGRALTTP